MVESIFIDFVGPSFELIEEYGCALFIVILHQNIYIPSDIRASNHWKKLPSQNVDGGSVEVKQVEEELQLLNSPSDVGHLVQNEELRLIELHLFFDQAVKRPLNYSGNVHAI